VRAVAIADDEDDDPPPRPRRKPSGRAKSRRPKRGRGNSSITRRWAGSLRSAVRSSIKWASILATLFVVVIIAGLFSGGHVQAMWEDVGESFGSLMADAGLTVQSVTLEGRAETARTDIIRMLGIKRGTLMIDVDVDEARARLEALPWVQSAEVRRVWPDRIYVRVVERKPVAIWQNDGELAVIDRVGHTIAGEDVTRFTNLPLVVGKGADAAAAGLLDLLARQPQLRDHVKAAVRVGERRWNLRLDNGVEVRLPEEGAEAALAELVRLAREQDILSRDIKAIDLRFPDRLIVKLPQAQPLTPPAHKPAGGRDT
jgi:cell division protein FtsQ